MKIDIRRFLKYGVVSLGLLAGLNSCGSGGHNKREPPVPEPPANHIPVAVLNRESPNNGTMKYVVKGFDSDGFIEQIDTIFNGGRITNYFGDRFERAVPIVLRNNLFEATVYDDKGATDYKTDSFRVATRTEANQHIESLLINAGASYRPSSLSERLVYNLNHDPILVDFIIEPQPERGNFSVIRYVDIGELTQDAKIDERKFNSFTEDANGTVNNLYLYRLPIEDVTEQTSKFIEDGYRRPLQ